MQHSAMRLAWLGMDIVMKPKSEEDRRRREARNREQQNLAMFHFKMAIDVFTQGSGVRNAAGVFVSEAAGTGARGQAAAAPYEHGQDLQYLSDEESPRNWRDDEPAEGLSPDGVDMYPADMPLVPGAPTTAPYLAHEPAGDAPSTSNGTPPAGGRMAAVVGAAMANHGRESPSATGVAATLMLVREQGKLLRRVLAAQVALAAEQPLALALSPDPKPNTDPTPTRTRTPTRIATRTRALTLTRWSSQRSSDRSMRRRPSCAPSSERSCRPRCGPSCRACSSRCRYAAGPMPQYPNVPLPNTPMPNTPMPNTPMPMPHCPDAMPQCPNAQYLNATMPQCYAAIA
jgi:hypothetical protein